MKRNYISKSLLEVLDLLDGDWAIYEYQLVHHGWICTMKNLDRWPAEEPVQVFMHSEEGYVHVKESNQVDSKTYAQGLKDPADIAKVILSNIT